MSAFHVWDKASTYHDAELKVALFAQRYPDLPLSIVSATATCLDPFERRAAKRAGARFVVGPGDLIGRKGML